MATVHRNGDLSRLQGKVAVVGSPEELDSFEELVRPHGLKELARTGRIGLARASTARAPRRQHVLR